MKLAFLFAYCAFIASAAAQSPALSIDNRGVVIDVGSMGRFTLEAPTFSLSTGGAEKPVFEKTGQQSAVARYPSGTELLYAVESGKVKFTFKNAPAEGKA